MSDTKKIIKSDIKEKNRKHKRINLKSKKNKRLIIRIMCFIVMNTFLFNGALNQAYAISNENKETASDEEIIKDMSTDEVVGTNEEGKKYTYDALEIAKKLKNADYSNDGKKIVFLTFDDGASNTVTPKILKILDECDVKATFFIVGSTVQDGGDVARNLVKEEFDKGHAIGNHSYSHDYNILYPQRVLNLESFKADYKKNSDLLKEILGDNFSTRVIRCPGGYMSWKNMSELDGYLDENNIAAIDWSALSGDAEGKKKEADELLRYTVETSMNKDIVVLLMHDTYGKEETVKALPKIIDYFKQHGYDFKTLA